MALNRFLTWALEHYLWLWPWRLAAWRQPSICLGVCQTVKYQDVSIIKSRCLLSQHPIVISKITAKAPPSDLLGCCWFLLGTVCSRWVRLGYNNVNEYWFKFTFLYFWHYVMFKHRLSAMYIISFGYLGLLRFFKMWALTKLWNRYQVKILFNTYW